MPNLQTSTPPPSPPPNRTASSSTLHRTETVMLTNDNNSNSNNPTASPATSALLFTSLLSFMICYGKFMISSTILPAATAIATGEDTHMQSSAGKHECLNTQTYLDSHAFV
ncbi:unnamed protein product [Ceratitis capitata]|uniref:(Mediterranean fruit fly) hypothetical protein n=1 Tax=Ceratitis capitata TaxID=7213 RepID=A0A811V7B5_CERCA|nr:unnamed protein product [Ceratitis capitata]